MQKGSEFKKFLSNKIRRNPVTFVFGLGVLLLLLLFIISITLFVLLYSKNSADDVVSKKRAARVGIAEDRSLAKQKPLQGSSLNLPTEINAVSENTQNIKPKEAATQRCTYRGQTYIAGDIIKSDEVWIRCTPTIIFIEVEDKATRVSNPIKQAGSPVWSVVQ